MHLGDETIGNKYKYIDTDKINKGESLAKNTVLVVLDVKALYTNIIHEQGLHVLEAKLEQITNA